MGKLTISMAIFNSYVKLPEAMCLKLCVEFQIAIPIAKGNFQLATGNGVLLAWPACHFC